MTNILTKYLDPLNLKRPGFAAMNFQVIFARQSRGNIQIFPKILKRRKSRNIALQSPGSSACLRINDGLVQGLAQGLAQGREEGETQTKLAIARRLLPAQSMRKAQIAEITGLNIEDIE